MREATKLFIGTHDFTSFTNDAGSGAAARNAVRLLTRLVMFEQEYGLRFEFESNGFLYKMVRNIMGALIEVGAGRREVEDITRLLMAKDRKVAGKAAPPHGLFLVKVDYK
jgi:tRNA pseudouridine38-40 synthase